jgi:hypothetical protein
LSDPTRIFGKLDFLDWVIHFWKNRNGSDRVTERRFAKYSDVFIGRGFGQRLRCLPHALRGELCKVSQSAPILFSDRKIGSHPPGLAEYIGQSSGQGIPLGFGCALVHARRPSKTRFADKRGFGTELRFGVCEWDGVGHN